MTGYVKSRDERIYDSLTLSENLPEAELRDYTDGLLATVVLHAQNTVPYYESRLSSVLSPAGTIDREAWNSVPLLRRSDVLQNFESLASSRVPKAHGVIKTASTSGTTGVPVKVLKNELTSLMERALLGRFYRWVGINPRHRLIMIKGNANPLLRFRDPEPGPWVPGWMAGTTYGDYARLHHPISAEDQLDFLASQGAIYLNTQPSNARSLMRAISTKNVPRPDVRGIITLGELVTEEHRQLAMDVFGCRLLDTYSATEVATIAAQCSCGSLHVNAECVRVEIVNSAGMVCPDGEEGRIVVTTLTNSAMPLVRYEIGDIGVLGGECGCGLTLPKLTLTVGRERRMFRFSDGSTVVPLFSLDKYSNDFPVSQWQLAQIEAETVEVRFSSDAPESGLRYDTVTAALREYFNRPIDVRYRRHRIIPVGATGKLEQSVREI